MLQSLKSDICNQEQHEEHGTSVGLYQTRIRSGWGTRSLSGDKKSTGEMERMEEVHKISF